MIQSILNLGPIVLGIVCIVLLFISSFTNPKDHEIEECDYSQCKYCPFPCDNRKDKK